MNSVHVSTASNQAHVTPRKIMGEIAHRFGISFCLDLACNEENMRCDRGLAVELVDSLTCHWSILLNGGVGWLNPPFKGVDPWMEKCKTESSKGARIISLTLASLGTGWYRNHVEGEALSLILRERVVFDGQKDPFPKELMITLWGLGMTGLGFWSRKTITPGESPEEAK